jgi:hypothetical protein
MGEPPLVVKIQAGPRCISVPGEHALIGATGFFVRGVQLPVGTALIVKFCRGQDVISLRGTVATSYADLGLSVRFDEKAGSAVQNLYALQAPERAMAR